VKIVTAEEMRRMEKATDASGHSYDDMMELAGKAAADVTHDLLEENSVDRVLVLVGPGNNGGDGLVAARHLCDQGHDVTLYIWKRNVTDDQNFAATQSRDIPVLWAEEDEGLGRLREQLAATDVVLDALLGTGVSRPITGVLKEILEAVADRREHAAASRQTITYPAGPGKPPERRPFVVAVDMPTGLHTDDGFADPATLAADVTVTFAFPKRGMFLPPGLEFVGRLAVADIGISESLARDIRLNLVTAEVVRPWLPRRPVGAHKGTFGKALIVAGSANYPGAPALACAAATRVGAGLVTLAAAPPVASIVAAHVTEVTHLMLPHDLGAIVPDALSVVRDALEGYRAVLLGPGLGQDEKTIEFVYEFLGVSTGALRARIGFIHQEEPSGASEGLSVPTVIDADALNALAKNDGWWNGLRCSAVLTPHPGEMARLTGRETGEVQADRLGVAHDAAARWGQTVVLKGAHTVVAQPDGETWVLPFANPALATAGSGDVLAGAIVGLMAQGVPAGRAAVAGAFLHGLAGEIVRQEIGPSGPVAGDLIAVLPEGFRLAAGEEKGGPDDG
jgi:NAD(P)H-hydrate epimerase